MNDARLKSNTKIIISAALIPLAITWFATYLQFIFGVKYGYQYGFLVGIPLGIWIASKTVFENKTPAAIFWILFVVYLFISTFIVDFLTVCANSNCWMMF